MLHLKMCEWLSWKFSFWEDDLEKSGHIRMGHGGWFCLSSTKKSQTLLLHGGFFFFFYFSCKEVFCWPKQDAILYAAVENTGQNSDLETFNLKTPIKHLNGVTKKEFGSKSEVQAHWKYKYVNLQPT